MLISLSQFIADPLLTAREIFIFDKDGTLTEPNQPLDADGVRFLTRCLEKKKCILLTARDLDAVTSHILDRLPDSANFSNLIFGCSNGSEIYTSENSKKYKKISAIPGNIMEHLSEIEEGIKKVEELTGTKLTLEPRSDTMCVLVCIPRTASRSEREGYDPDKQKRVQIGEILKPYFPYGEIISGGSTSIDLSLADKYAGLHHLYETLDFSSHDAIFFGDNFGPHGNDAPILRDPIVCVDVENPQELYGSVS